MKRFARFVAVGLMFLGARQLAEAQTLVPKFGLWGWVDASGVQLAWRQTYANNGSVFTIYRSNDTTLTDFVRIDSTTDTTYIDHPAQLVGQNLLQFYIVRAVGQRGPDSGKVLSSNMIVVIITGIPPVGSYLLQATPQSNHSVQLNWTKPRTAVSGEYSIWRKPDTTGATFTAAFDSTADTTYTDKPPVVIGKRNAFVYQVSVSSSGGPVLKSSTAAVSFFVPIIRDTLQSTVPPTVVGQAGKLYSYNPGVVSTDPTAKLRYYLYTQPAGMTIDSTGLVQWTPASRGWYSVGILAVSSKLGYLRIAYDLTIASGNGIIQGTVTDTSGKGIRNVDVIAYQRDGVRHLQYFGRTDTSGSYRLNYLDPGNYIIRAVPFNPKFVGSWYNNQTEPQYATILAVVDSTSPSSVVTANFVLKTRVIGQPLFGVHGWVRDTSGLKVRGSYVVLVRAQFGLNGSGTDSLDDDDFKDFFNRNQSVDWRLDGISEHVFLIGTDSLGNFNDRVPAGSYIAFARAPGYPRVFYSGQSSLLAAQIIRVTSRVDSINFTLTPFPPYTLGSISGQVTDTSGSITPVISRILAFRDRWYFRDSLLTSRVYETDSDSLGRYTLSDLLPGAYRILAVPLGDYVPTFYAFSMPSRSWAQSTAVTVNGNSVSGIDMITRPIDRGTSGYTGITGIVTSNSGLGKITTASVVPGSIVSVTDPTSGNVVAYGFTDNTGTYSISGLAPGTYNVSVDYVGLNAPSTQQVTVSYDANGNPVIGNVSFTMAGVTSVEGPSAGATLPQTFTLRQNYPNPFNPSTTIAYSLPQNAKVSLKIFNILGQEVATLVNGIEPPGDYRVKFDASRLASGVYFYRLQADNFIQTKKLLLLK